MADGTLKLKTYDGESAVYEGQVVVKTEALRFTLNSRVENRRMKLTINALAGPVDGHSRETIACQLETIASMFRANDPRKFDAAQER